MDNIQDASSGREVPARAVAHVLDLIRGLFEGMQRSEAPVPASSTETKRDTPTIEIKTADALRKLAAGAPERREQDQQASHDQESLAVKQRVKELLQKHLQDAMWNELLSHIQPAAEHGDHQFQLLRFPSDLCSDGGRKIRIGDEDWQETLRGEAAELAERWKRDLQPKGIGLSCEMLDYPNGMPGDIGLFVTWAG